MGELDKMELEKKERETRYEKREKKRKEIRDDLLTQLKDNQLNNPFLIDLVDDYMALWDNKSELIHDVREKGVNVMYQNGANQWGYKKNDSVPELNRVNGQMLKLLSELMLKPSKVETEEYEFKL